MPELILSGNQKQPRETPGQPKKLTSKKPRDA